MKVLTRTAVAALLLAVSLTPAARADGNEARQSDGFRQDMQTMDPADPYAAFVQFDGGSRPEHAQVLANLKLGAGRWFPSIDTVYAYGEVRAFAALVTHPLVRYLEDIHEFTRLGETAVWSTRAKVAQSRAMGGPFRDAQGRILDGTGVGVAVVDTGVDGTHPDLASRMAANFKVVCSTPVLQSGGRCFGDVVYQQVPDSDSAGHGTHVAGIVAGDGTASDGTYKGVAPGARLYGFSWFEGASVNNLQSAAAFDWVRVNGATADPPVKVVTNSWGCVGGCAYDGGNIVNQLANQLVGQGVTVLWAAGNDGGTGSANVLSGYAKNPTPGVIGVAGSFDNDTGTRDGTMYSDSSRASSNPADAPNYPDISAPGQFISSTCTHRKPDCETGAWIEWPEFYASLTGTSMSTPHVAGAVALLYQANPALTPAAIEDVLLDNALKISGSPGAPGPYIADPQNPGGTTSFDKGAGLLNVPAALSDPRVAAVKDGVGRNGTPTIGITAPAAGGDVVAPVTLAGTASDGTYALSDHITIATDPDDYDGPGAGELRELSMADLPGALGFAIRVADVDDRYPGGVARLIVQYRMEGIQKSTSLEIRGTGLVNPAQDTGTNTHRASTFSMDAATDTVTFTVSHATLGNPAPNTPVHNIRAFVQAGTGVIVIQDTMPGEVADNLAHPRYGDPFTVNGVVDPAPAATVEVAVDGGPAAPATVTGSGPYTWSLDLGALPPGQHQASATLKLNGIPRAQVTRAFRVVVGNLAPVLGAIGDKAVAEMGTLIIDVQADDADHAESDLTLDADPMPPGASITGTGPGAWRFRWRPDSHQQGTRHVTFTVTDPLGAEDTEQIAIDVANVEPGAVGPGGLEYPTIQAALNASGPGDTVLVLPGVHVGSLSLSSAITLCGSLNGATCIADRADAGAVTLRPGGGAPVVRTLAPGATIQGLTLDAFDVGVSVEAASTQILHVRLGQGSRGVVGGAVDGTTLRLSICTMQTTTCAGFAAGVAGRTIDARMNDWSVYVDALVQQRMNRGAGTILFRPYLTS